MFKNITISMSENSTFIYKKKVFIDNNNNINKLTFFLFRNTLKNLKTTIF